MIRRSNIKRIVAVASALAMLTAGLTGCAKEERLARQAEDIQMGKNALDSGQYDLAVDAFNAALGESLGHVGATEIDVNYYKAAAQNMAGNYEGAIETYTAVIDYKSTDPNPYFLRGSVYLALDNEPSAVSDYRMATSLCDKDYELYIQIYNNLANYGDQTQAMEFLNAALAVNDKSAISYLMRGRIYYIMEQYELAENELLTAQKKDKAEAAIYLAQVYEAEGRYDEAESVLDVYLSTGTPTCTALNTMGLLSMQKGDYKNALMYFDQGLNLELVTNEQSLMRNKIIAMEYLGMFSEARVYMNSYLAQYPKDEQARREAVFLETRGASASEQAPPEPLEEETEGDGEENADAAPAA